MEHAELTITDEWNNVKDELIGKKNSFDYNFNICLINNCIAETREILKTIIINLAKTNNELSNVKGDLTNTTIDLANKLEGILNYWN
jgi:hypothetical protein